MKFNITDISELTEVSLSKLPKDGMHCRSFLFPGRERYTPKKLLWENTLPASIVREHHDTMETPHVFIYNLSPAIVFGPNLITCTEGNFLFSKHIYPPWVQRYLEQGLVHISATPQKLSPKVIKQPCFSILNFRYSVYGHFLLETIPKLFLIKCLMERGWNLPIILPNNAPGYIKAIIKTILPKAKYIEYDINKEYISAHCLLLPSWMANSYLFHSFVAAQCEQLAVNLAFGNPHIPRRIFVSRPERATYRHMENSKEIEKLAKKAGLQIVQPETMDWHDQVRLFYSARLIVGEFGSGLHNALFSRPGTYVVALNWINHVQSYIGTLCRHENGYILPEDGIPRVHDFALKSKVQRFRISPREFEDKIATLLG